MRPLVANYYITYKCNDACEFCPTWQDNKLQETGESSLEEIKKNLDELKSLGIASLDITGGEPLLKKELKEILKHAKEKDFLTTLTTNCILYPDLAKEITPYIDKLYFSLDSPTPDEHDRIRGTACFDLFLKSVEKAKSLGKSPIINFTVTRESIRFLPEMADLAQSLGILLWVNPVYDYGGLEGFTNETIEHIKYFSKNKNVAFNLAALELIKSFGNNTEKPRCKASHATITLSPDNYLMFPCFKNKKGKIKIEKSIKESLEKAKDLNIHDGKMQICNGCMMWPYMLPSFSYKIDKYFILNLRSLFNLYWKEYKIKKGANT